MTALVTPSYAPDFERFRLLHESVRRFTPESMTHVAVVDRRDLSLFESLVENDGKLRLLTVEEVLPRWIFRVPAAKRWWMSLRSAPVRNWIMQQMVKLSMPLHVDDEVIVFCDSDVVFLRTWDESRFLRSVDGDERLAMSRVDFDSADLARWRLSAKRLLGLPADLDIAPVNHVSNLIPWRRSVALAMHERISESTGLDWLVAVAREHHLSEYTIYGIFVEHVLGLEEAKTFFWDDPILHLSFGNRFQSEGEVDEYLDQMHPDHVGVMFHSKDGLEPSLYRPCIERRWG